MLINIGNIEKEQKISRVHLVREAVEVSILDSMSQTLWSKNVAFYGGTALRLAYGSPRYSEDIDLFILKQFPYDLFESWVKGLDRALDFDITVEDVHCKRNTYFALLKIQHAEVKHALPLKIELYRNMKHQLGAGIELRLLKSPLSPLSPLIQVSTLDVLKRMKVDALAERAKPRDFYDLWYLSQLQRTPFVMPDRLPKYHRRLFENELKVYLPQNHHQIISQLWKMYEQSYQKN